MTSLYRVERTSRPKRGGHVSVAVFAVLAESASEARAKAEAVDPQSQFDGPVVHWAVEEDAEGVLRAAGGGYRKPTAADLCNLSCEEKPEVDARDYLVED